MKRRDELDKPMEADGETAVSEITILPDGRVFVLGAARQVLEILNVLNPRDAGLKQRLECIGGEEVGGDVAPSHVAVVE